MLLLLRVILVLVVPALRMVFGTYDADRVEAIR